MTLIVPIALIVFWFLTIEKGTIMTNDPINEIFKYLIPVFGLISIPLGFTLFKNRLKNIKGESNIDLKVQIYHGLSTQRIAFIGAIAVLSAIAYIFTLNSLYIAYTIISLALCIPIYPTIDKLRQDLDLDDDSIDSYVSNNINKNSWVKKPWFIVILISFLIISNYNSFKDLLKNRVVLPSVQVDSGVITDSIYHNNYLDWTFIIPPDYNIIPTSEIESVSKKGNKLINNKTTKSTKPIRLLNISNGALDLMSNLNPRVLFPNLTSEEVYFDIIGKKLKNASNDKIRFEKQNQGEMEISNLIFKYIEYTAITETGNSGMMYISRFNQDYMLDISLNYIDPHEAIKIIDKLKKSNLNWK